MADSKNLRLYQLTIGVLDRPNVKRRQKLKVVFQKFLADESGATAIEYGLIAAGIGIAIITAVKGVGGQLSTNFDTIKTKLTTP